MLPPIFGIQQLADPVIRQVAHAPFVDHDVARLQIPMHDVMLVQLTQCQQHAPADAQHFGLLQGRLGRLQLFEQTREWQAFDVLHHEFDLHLDVRDLFGDVEVVVVD